MKRLLFILVLVCSFVVSYAQNTVIDDELQEILNRNDSEMINVNIIMKSQLEPSLLQTRVENITDRKERRDVVVSELKSFAEKSQNDVMSIIKSAEMRGDAKKIKSHWLKLHRVANFLE